VLTLSACGGSGGSIEEETQANESQAAEAGGECGDLNMAVNPWVGFEASTYVVGHVAEDTLGCTVNYKDLKEDVSWQGFGTGEVDVVIEDWGHTELEKLFFAEKGDGTATDFGPNGNVGIIGWYVPPWLAAENPDVLDWENLNDYAEDWAKLLLAWPRQENNPMPMALVTGSMIPLVESDSAHSVDTIFLRVVSG